MTEITVTLTDTGGQLANGLTDTPVIDIRRLDTKAFVVTNDPMVDSGSNGLYTYTFTPVAGLGYQFLIDADPNVTGQVEVRYHDGTFDNEITDIWNDRGLNPNVDKTITEITQGEDYDHAVATPTPVNKNINRVNNITTINRSP